MALYAIQHASEIQDGPAYLVKASHLTDNFNAIISDFADRLSLISSTPQTILGTLTFAAGLNTDTIAERTLNNGVTAGGVLLKTGMAVLNGTPTVPGQIGYAGNQFQGFRNATLKNFLMSGDATALPTSYINGVVPKFTSTTSITVPAGLKARDSQDVSDITITSNVVISTGTTGAAGLDTGTIANNTWYYLYLLQNPTNNTSSALLSTVNESATGSITLPTGYTLKRQLPIAFRTNGSAQILPFIVGAGWPFRPEILYQTQLTYYNGTSTPLGTTNLLSAGVATTATTINAGSFIPPISRLMIPNLITVGRPSSYALRETGTTNYTMACGDFNGGTTYQPRHLSVNSSQQFDYIGYSVTGPLYVDAAGFVVTEIA